MARRVYSRLTSGFEELDKALAELKTGVANKAVRKGQIAACKVLKQAMRSAAPTKDLKKSIGYRVGLVRYQHQAKVGVGVGFGKFKKETSEKNVKKNQKIRDARKLGWLSMLYVLGTKARYRHAKGIVGRLIEKAGLRSKTSFQSGFTGVLRPHASFVAAATSSSEGAALAAQEQVIRDEIAKAWATK